MPLRRPRYTRESLERGRTRRARMRRGAMRLRSWRPPWSWPALLLWSAARAFFLLASSASQGGGRGVEAGEDEPIGPDARCLFCVEGRNKITARRLGWHWLSAPCCRGAAVASVVSVRHAPVGVTDREPPSRAGRWCGPAGSRWLRRSSRQGRSGARPRASLGVTPRNTARMS